MYHLGFTKTIKDVLESDIFSSSALNYCMGDLFWINNSSVPSAAHAMLAAGLSNDKVCFKGAVKNGISDLMAAQHRHRQAYEITTSMLGLITDSVVRDQKITEPYK